VNSGKSPEYFDLPLKNDAVRRKNFAEGRRLSFFGGQGPTMFWWNDVIKEGVPP